MIKTGTPEQAYSRIFWDLNDTLLDDVTQSMDCFKHLLAERGLPLVEGVNEYQNHFSFPVQDYYRRIGFDLEREPIEHLAVHYMKLFHQVGCGVMSHKKKCRICRCDFELSQRLKHTQNIAAPIKQCGEVLLISMSPN